MYEYIQGEIDELNPAYLVLQCGGVGYALHISLNTFSALQGSTSAKVYTHDGMPRRFVEYRKAGFIDCLTDQYADRKAVKQKGE